MNSGERRLKLKVSRGAMARARRQTGGTSGASLDSLSHCSAPGPLNHDHPSKRKQLERGTLTRNATAAPPGVATRRRSKYLADPPSAAAASASQKPTAPNENEKDEILALFSSSHSRVNGKALRRLKKRFPALGARFAAELQLQLPQVHLPEPLAASTAAAADTPEGTGITAGVGTTEGTGCVKQQQQKRRSAGDFLRGRVAVWMRKARQAVTRARSGERGGE
jgi:hypothetical protein